MNRSEDYQQRMAHFQKLLSEHQRIVFFGGAGVSTESDIPDFRGRNGLYRRPTDSPYSAEEMLSHHFFAEHPQLFFENYKIREEEMLRVRPNRAHYALVELEKAGRLTAIVTQNIDGLHQLAGSTTVYELHGSVRRHYCMKCRRFYDSVAFIARCTPIPHCDCGAVIKPDVVLYEESLPNDVVIDAVDAIRAADLLIIGGTSLVVWPAAGFTREFAGDALVLINEDPTPRDQDTDLLFNESVGQVLADGVAGLSR